MRFKARLTFWRSDHSMEHCEKVSLGGFWGFDGNLGDSNRGEIATNLLMKASSDLLRFWLVTFGRHQHTANAGVGH